MSALSNYSSVLDRGNRYIGDIDTDEENDQEEEDNIIDNMNDFDLTETSISLIKLSDEVDEIEEKNDNNSNNQNQTYAYKEFQMILFDVDQEFGNIFVL
jgi:hypothetical protein